jgi:hypothetical protein
MTKRALYPAALVMVCCGCLLWAAENANPSVKTPATLPEAARRQLTRLFPDSEIFRVDLKSMDGRSAYAIKGISRDGNRRFWLYVTPNAEVIRIAEQLEDSEVPQAIQKAAGKAFPGAAIETAEKKSEIKVSYFLKVLSEGKRFDLLLSPEGNILEIRKDGNLTNANTAN